MRRRLALAAGVAAAAAAGTAAAAAPISLHVTPSTARRGHLVVVYGSAGTCPVGDAVTVISRAFAHTHDFAGVPAVFAAVRGGGHFRTTTRIPAARRLGRYGVTARCGGGNLGVEAFLTVR